MRNSDTTQIKEKLKLIFTIGKVLTPLRLSGNYVYHLL
jgi:hypothetical protein